MAKRGPKGRHSGSFKPGQSGNPSGGPKKTPEQREFEEACRSYSPLALARVVAILNPDIENGEEHDPNMQLQAAKLVFDRAWGTAKQSTEITGKDGAPLIESPLSGLSREELVALAREAINSKAK